jgi:oligopeptide transport system permease protein
VIEIAKTLQGAAPLVISVHRLLRNRTAMLGAYSLAAIAFACAFGPYFIPFDATVSDFASLSQPPSLASGHFLGTDELGRDLLARILSGGRVSLLIGLSATTVSIILGSVYGAIAGFLGGRSDQLMMRMVDVLYGIPFIFFVIMLTTVIGRGLLSIFIAISAVLWLTVAVVVRAQALSLKRRPFVEAARAGGMRPLSIIRYHIIPNTSSSVIVYASLLIPDVVLGESFLSYLGLGVQDPVCSWGTLIDAGSDTMGASPWQLFFPAAALAATLFSLNFIADGVRDAFDPRAERAQ